MELRLLKSCCSLHTMSPDRLLPTQKFSLGVVLNSECSYSDIQHSAALQGGWLHRHTGTTCEREPVSTQTSQLDKNVHVDMIKNSLFSKIVNQEHSQRAISSYCCWRFETFQIGTCLLMTTTRPLLFVNFRLHRWKLQLLFHEKVGGILCCFSLNERFESELST